MGFGAEVKTKDGLLPMHVLCGAGKHTPSSYRIFQKLVEAHADAVMVRTAQNVDADGGERHQRSRRCLDP